MDRSCKNTYFAGGFNGGSSKEFLRMSREIKENIEKDYEKNIIAIWHDESHMNKWFYENKPDIVLGTQYCIPSNRVTDKTKISAIVKKHEKYR